MFCVYCGKEIIDENASFCPSCGKKLDLNIKVTNDLKTDNSDVVGKNKSEDEKTDIKKEKESTIAEKAPKNENNSEKKKNVLVFIGVAASIIILIIIVSLVTSNQKMNLQDIYKQEDSTYCSISDDGNSITVDTDPNDIGDNEEGWPTVKSVDDLLDLPDSLETKFSNTRAIDGNQTETYGRVTVSWTYDPDSGLNVVYELN